MMLLFCAKAFLTVQMFWRENGKSSISLVGFDEVAQVEMCII